jgi:hypothetical protein
MYKTHVKLHKQKKKHISNRKNKNMNKMHTPWILLPVTGHLGPLALFLVVW